MNVREKLYWNALKIRAAEKHRDQAELERLKLEREQLHEESAQVWRLKEQ